MKQKSVLITLILCTLIVCMFFLVFFIKISEKKSPDKSTEQSTTAYETGYILGQHEGKLATYKANSSTPIEIFDIYISSLPEHDKEELEKGIIVVDLDSTDNTYEIISKLAKDYNFIKVSNLEECKELIDEISK